VDRYEVAVIKSYADVFLPFFEAFALSRIPWLSDMPEYHASYLALTVLAPGYRASSSLSPDCVNGAQLRQSLYLWRSTIDNAMKQNEEFYLRLPLAFRGDRKKYVMGHR